MKTVLIDVDEVICDNVYLKVLNKMLGTNKRPEDLTSYHVEDNFDLIAEKKIDFYKELRKCNAYEKGVVTQDCIDTIEKLSKVYDIYFCSAVTFKYHPEESGNYFKYKYDFLRKTFPFIDPKHCIFTTAKTLIDADVMIDDKPSNLMNDGFKTKLLFTAPHNKSMTKEELDKLGFIRVNNWKEIEEILLQKGKS